MAEYRYRCTSVTTEDYGNGPGARVESIAFLSVIYDGSYWRDRPAYLKIAVPAGTRPGAVYRVVIEEVDAQNG